MFNNEWRELPNKHPTKQQLYGHSPSISQTTQVCIYPTPLHEQDVTQGQFKAVFSRFDFRLFLLLDWLPNSTKEPSLPDYLFTSSGMIAGYILFRRVLVLCEKQSASSRVWTQLTMSVSYGDNHYTTYTSQNIQIKRARHAGNCWES